MAKRGPVWLSEVLWEKRSAQAVDDKERFLLNYWRDLASNQNPNERVVEGTLCIVRLPKPNQTAH